MQYAFGQNIEDIKDLILNKKFIPFPARPSDDATHVYKEYPPSRWL